MEMMHSVSSDVTGKDSLEDIEGESNGWVRKANQTIASFNYKQFAFLHVSSVNFCKSLCINVCIC